MSTQDTPPPLPSIKQVVETYKLDQQKHLGQHFLYDMNLTDKIARCAGPLENRTVIEIGPGPGALTRALLANHAGKVIAIEKDPRCVEALYTYLLPHYPDRLVIMAEDALTVDMASLMACEGRSGVWGQEQGECRRSTFKRAPATNSKPAPAGKVVANLPYNVATRLLVQWLEQVTIFESLTLMFQKEVAKRICAVPGNKDYGRLSVFTQWLCDTKWHFDITPKAFFPPPKITSSVISLIPLPAPRFPAEKGTLEYVCKVAFQQRRKMLRASLKSITPTPEVLLEKAGIDPTARPETLSVEAFCRLANAADAGVGILGVSQEQV